MRLLRSPWPLGAALVALSALQYLTTPSYTEQLRPLAEMLGPETAGEIGTLLTVSAVLVPLLSLLWLVFWKYPPNVRLFAFCRERFGRSLLWSLLLGGSALWNLSDAATDVVASRYLNALSDLGSAVCMVALRAVVVSRIEESQRKDTAPRSTP